MNDMIVSFAGGKKVNADFNGFTIKTDQGVYAGGEGTAPEPFSLFLASIGTCAGIFVLSFCQNRDISTDGIRIVQSHQANESGRGVGKITITIELPPDFPEKYKDAVINVANLCAVKKHIMEPPVFEVRTKTVAEG
ncbi:MAG: osmotically inducible protein C [Chlorobiaceae bacterium]|nr:osmotically inducible protein C [Chlorobiaceae bacterium]